ncbi:MAG: hypothetical protein K0Q59_903 [Paenibacillus sp.]|nr:hypothetical protein [Paenibacillus sp.]
MGACKAVLFDLFETLISEYADGVRKAPRSTHSVAERLGLEHDAYRKEWSVSHNKRMTGELGDFRLTLKSIAEKCGKTANDSALQTLYEERLAEKAAAFRDNDAEVVVMLQRLKEQGLKIGLISNCTEEEVRGWDGCGLGEWFDDVIFSYQVGLAKPDTAIYKLACERLGVQPEQCMFIGDGGSNELNGAETAGMRACHAVWQLPLSMRDRITGFPKLARPLETLDALSSFK